MCSDKMESFKGSCPHRCGPVEMDESMTCASLDLAWPPFCQECNIPTKTRLQDNGREQTGEIDRCVNRLRCPDVHFQLENRTAYQASPERPLIPNTHMRQMSPPPVAVSLLPGNLPVLHLQSHVVDYSRSFSGFSNWPQECLVEEAESLVHPLPLKSDFTHNLPSRHPAAPMTGHRCCPAQRRCVCHHPANPPCHNYKQDDPRNAHQMPQPNQQWRNYPENNLQFQGAPNATNTPASQRVVLPRNVIHEVSIQADPGPVTGETRRTISLPEECRNVFITYSVDTAKEMFPFTRFLTDQGFKPAIDIFDNPIRRMGITKWMDRFLNDKSVLIIVVISPKYKEDVEGNGDDEHGLHTNYIHNQIQNEFIQQGCLNFRLVPVLFPNATRMHIPSWLRSTRIYRWPQDTQDLLLRLLREERYIIPPPVAGLTLTVRPL
ncbi:uncharacterized protein traf3ip2a isoform 1-T2 [Aulostomus maculatus]